MSDLHVGMTGADDYWPNVEEILYEDLRWLLPRCGGLDVVLFTGDLVQRGAQSEYDAATRRLEALWAGLFERELSIAPPLLAVPGNHDLVRPAASDDTAKVMRSLWREVRDGFWSHEDSQYRGLVRRCFENYDRWWRGLPLPKPQQESGMLPGDFTAVLEKEGLRLGVLGLNSTFRQMFDGSMDGEMELHVSQFNAACSGHGPNWTSRQDACLLLTHHPPSWLNEQGKVHLSEEINRPGRFAAHLFGHMHEANLTSVSQGGDEAVGTVQGYSLFGMDGWGDAGADRIHGYVVGQLRTEGDHLELRFWPRRATRRKGRGWTFERDQQWALPKGEDATPPRIVRRARSHPGDPSVEPAPAAPEARAPARAVAHNLIPPPSEDLYGRERELALILEALSPQSGRTIVNVTGLRGVGRTSLAWRAAQDAVSHPESWDGVLWLSARLARSSRQGVIQGEEPLRWTIDDLFHALATALIDARLLQAKPEDRPALATERLAHGRHLLVLDDADAMHDPRLPEFLARLPAGNKVLAVSVQPLPYGDFTVPLSPPVGQRVVPEDAVERLWAGFSRHQVRLLEALTLYPEPADEAAIAAASGLPLSDCRSEIVSLAESDVLERDPASGRLLIRRLELQELIAARLQEDAPRGEALARRAVEHMAALARELSERRGWDEMARQVGNLMWAARRSLELGDLETTLRFRTTLGQFFHERGYVHEAVQLGDWIFTAADLLGRHAERAWTALYPLARTHLYQRNLQAARLWALRSEAIFRQQGDLYGIAAACRTLGRVAKEEGRHEEARAQFVRGLELARRFNTERAHLGIQAGLLCALGDLALEQKHYREAMLYRDEAWELYRKTGDAEGKAEVLRQRAQDVAQRGEPRRAEPLLQEALRTTPSDRQRARLLLELGGLLEQRGDRAAASNRFESAARHARTAADAALQAAAEEALQRVAEIR